MPRKSFIAGIHNYCDRRCERCELTDRCRVFADLQKAARRHRRRGEDPDDPEVALEDAGRALAKVRRLIVRHARQMGIDLDEIVRQAALAPAADRSAIDDHPLAREGMGYFELGLKLAKAVGEEVAATRKDLVRRSRFMDVNGEVESLAGVSEALDVLGWDISLVAVKIHRVLDGLIDDDEDNADDVAFHRQDAWATAALVRRCLDRDQRALQAIYGWSTDHRDLALDLLAKTERLGRTLRRLTSASI
jgi:hypothetical protein